MGAGAFTVKYMRLWCDDAGVSQTRRGFPPLLERGLKELFAPEG